MGEWNETPNGVDANNAWEYWVNIYSVKMPNYSDQLDNLAQIPIGG